jgi:hypothetical protein
MAAHGQATCGDRTIIAGFGAGGVNSIVRRNGGRRESIPHCLYPEARDESQKTTVPRKASMPGKRIQFDDETWAALDLLARDRMMTFQELADEAFRDVLRKHNRPAGLREALRKSAGASADVVPFKRRTAGERKPETRKRRRSKLQKKRT